MIRCCRPKPVSRQSIVILDGDHGKGLVEGYYTPVRGSVFIPIQKAMFAIRGKIKGRVVGAGRHKSDLAA